MRLLLPLLGAFTAATLTWVLWRLFTPGDFFDHRNVVVYLVLGVAAVAGAWCAYQFPSNSMRIALLATSALGLLFWTMAPSGWWAKKLPPSTQSK